MTMLRNILSMRGVTKRFFLDIVYEWEDVLAQSLDAKLRVNWIGFYKFGTAINVFVPWLWDVLQFRKLYLSFLLQPTWWDFNVAGKKNIIPVLIDFWYREGESRLTEFYRRYAGNPLVLVTSREAYCYLKRIGCPLNIRHWGLSLPDKYAISPTTTFEKVYDCVLVGRPNHVFADWIRRYAATHADFVYVYNIRKPKSPNCYVSSDGKVLGDVVKTRGEYMSLLRQSRIGLYATPSMDGGRVDGNGFNQVTPRFLEYVACGCHVLARYPQNEDTDWYDMSSIAQKIDSYDEFEKAVDVARRSPVDIEKYAKYLSRHYTSVRAKELMSILKELK